MYFKKKYYCASFILLFVVPGIFPIIQHFQAKPGTNLLQIVIISLWRPNIQGSFKYDYNIIDYKLEYYNIIECINRNVVNMFYKSMEILLSSRSLIGALD